MLVNIFNHVPYVFLGALQWHIQLLQPLMPLGAPLLQECSTLGVLNILFKHLLLLLVAIL
jgi:hypothetical protein